MARCSQDTKIQVAIIEPNLTRLEDLVDLVAATPGVTLSGNYSDYVGALPKLRRNPPDMVIADLEAFNDQAATWLEQLHKALPHASVLILSTKKKRDQLFQVLEAGVSGWLQKPCTSDQIVSAIIILRDGGAVLSNPIARQILDYFRAREKSVQCLSGRQREILGLLSHGKELPSIAKKLGIGPSTVRTHVRNMLLKLKVNSRTKAVAKYLNPSE